MAGIQEMHIKDATHSMAETQRQPNTQQAINADNNPLPTQIGD